MILDDKKPFNFLRSDCGKRRWQRPWSSIWIRPTTRPAVWKTRPRGRQ